MDNQLNCYSCRRFGVEIEVNTLDGIIRKLDQSRLETPLGSEVVSRIISRAVKQKVRIINWDHVHNNDQWIVKPDSSCGIEINTPVLKGWFGLERLLLVIDGLKEGGILADERCSLHVHINIADLTKDQLASVIAHYIKCEHVFFDSVPSHRKNSRYCQLIGMTDLFEHNFNMNSDELINRISQTKYCSLNAYHFVRGGGYANNNIRKKTLEFRIMEGAACLNSWDTKNWVRLLLHFVEMTKNRPIPRYYEENDVWSSLLWLNPKDVFHLLGFDQKLSSGLQQVKNWFLKRLLTNGYYTGLPGIWSDEGRSVSRSELAEMVKDLEYEPESLQERTYGQKYIL